MPVDWDAQPLGQVPDVDLARELGCSHWAVIKARKRRGIPSFRCRRAWTREEDERLSLVWWHSYQPQAFDALARELGRTVHALRQRASDLGYTKRCPFEERWPRPLNLVIREWGYSRRRLLAIFDAAGIQFQRSSDGRKARILVNEADIPLMLAAVRAYPDGIRIKRKKR